MGRLIGIDLGTTNSVMATVDIGGCRILQNRENEQQTRSVVGFHKGDFLVGSPAMRRWPLAPNDTIISIKRLMGRAITDPEIEMIRKAALYNIGKPCDGTKDSVCVQLNGQEYSPVEISAKILSKLKNDAELVLGEEVTHTVITVPAYFSDKQRYATREAGLKAGLNVMKILDEPTAAAIAFGLDSREQEAKTLLVFDLGGGTFDISVLMMAAGTFAPLNLEGDMWLGSDNFDQVIVDYVVRQIKKEYKIDPNQNPRFMATLKGEAQKAKETLSAARVADLIIPGILQDNSGNFIDVEMEITREEFEDMIKPLLERIITIVKKAIENADFVIEDIDYVLMAGNAASIPKVQETMEQLFGKEKVLRKVHPKHSVAIGAAMTAAIYNAVNCPDCGHNNDLDSKECEKCGLSLVGILEKKNCPTCGKENNKEAEKCEYCNSFFIEIDSIKGGIAPFYYGVQTAGDTFHIFINKNDQYETPEDERRFQTFYTRIHGQRTISIPVYGGENLKKASKNKKQGEAFAILPRDCPEGTAILIKLWLNKDGDFELIAQLDDGTDLKPIILRGENDQRAVEQLLDAEEEIVKNEPIMSPEEKEKMEKLKDKVLDKMQEKDFAEAEKVAMELKKLAKEVVKLGDSIRIKAEGMMGFVTFIINQYSWLIGQQSVYRLNNLLGKLREAFDKNNQNLMENTMSEIDIEMQKYLKITDRTRIPLLVVFLGMRKAINTNIQPVEPAEANSLIVKLEEIEIAFRNRQPNAQSLLRAFDIKLKETIDNICPEDKGTICYICGYKNRGKPLYCGKCKANLSILRDEK